MVAPNGAETVLHSFSVGGSDGTAPVAGLVADSAGDLYGTTYEGSNFGCRGGGCGIVFRVAPDGTETALYTFTGGSDGYAPDAGLAMDGRGNLYGTALKGGAKGDGTVFKLAPDGTLHVLHAFSGGRDGGDPSSTLVLDKKGHLYGTAYTGGAGGSGVVFMSDQ